MRGTRFNLSRFAASGDGFDFRFRKSDKYRTHFFHKLIIYHLETTASKSINISQKWTQQMRPKLLSTSIAV